VNVSSALGVLEFNDYEPKRIIGNSQLEAQKENHFLRISDIDLNIQ